MCMLEGVSRLDAAVSTQVLAEQLPVFRAFWAGLSAAQQEELTTERSDLVLKVHCICSGQDKRSMFHIRCRRCPLADR